jgi:SAM-dependent methyltransferase
MTENSQNLFDRALLRQRRERVGGEFSRADFLVQRAAVELDERLDLVLRDFPIALDLGAGQGTMTSKLLARDNIGLTIAGDHSIVLMRDLAGTTKIVCDEEHLPFAEGSLNLVTSILSLHFVNDLPGALIQIRRALKPDGLFVAALPGGQTLIELRTAFTLAEEEILGGISPRVAPMADVREYGGLLQRAGFALPVVDSDFVTVSYENPLKLMHELRLMGAGNILADRLKKPLTRQLLQRVVDIYERQFTVDGRINATFEIIYMSGWAPHESQQQPLKPGSAQTSLEAAFGACALPVDLPCKDGEK